MLDRVSGSVESRAKLFGIAVIFCVAVVSVALTMQGWRSRIPAFDNLTYIYDARNFLQTGALSRFGDTDSYGSYSPPGTAWLMLVGMVLFRDPRLFEYAGAALLHIATLIGLFLLGRRFFGLWCAGLAVLLYGLSANALFFAGSLWPIARPDFYVLAVLLACWWVLKKDARYLAASLAVWGLGMYVDMAILPVFFIYPVLWFYYRPPLRFGPLIIAALVVFLVWSPHLQFEVSRHFADIRSQLLQQPIGPPNSRKTWCDQSLTLQTWQDPSIASPATSAQGQSTPQASSAPFSLLARFSNVWENLLSNFESVAAVPGASIALLLLTLISVLVLSVPGTIADSQTQVAHARFWRNSGRMVALGLLLGGLLLGALAFAHQVMRGDAPTAARFLFIGKLSKIMVWSGVALLAAPWIAAWANRLLARLRWQIQTPESAEQTRMLVFCLLVPWFILLLFSEPGKPERFIWLWPIQVLFLTAFFTNVLPRLGTPRIFVGAGVVALVLLIVANSFLLDRSSSWLRTGWAGSDATEVSAVDAISSRIKAEGTDRAGIGYQMFIYPFMAEYNITNPVYKVGAELDLIFLFKDGILNTDRCAEGLSPQDKYRIVETQPKPPDWSPKQYFSVGMDESYHLVGQYGTYQVYERP